MEFLVSQGRNERELCFRVLDGEKNPGIMFDVGAHYGGALASFAENGWEVFAFEPDPENRLVLKSKFGNFSNVHIDPRAVSKTSEKGIPFYHSDESSGISSLLPFHESHKETERVDVTTLEDYLKNQSLLGEQIDFLKIDTEGYDLFVLQGFPWESNSPRLILCEFEDKKTRKLGYGLSDLAKYLADRNYQMVISEWYPIHRYGRRHRWRRFTTYPCQLKDPQAWGNIIAAYDPDLYNKMLSFCGLYPGK
ncbi:MAG: FkbM family methyltransferase [Desulfatiglandales bacterium]